MKAMLTFDDDPLTTKKMTLLWGLGILVAHVVTGYYLSFLFFGPHPFMWGATTVGVGVIFIAELVYYGYRSILSLDSGWLRVLWALPLVIRTKSIPVEFVEPDDEFSIEAKKELDRFLKGGQ